MGWEPEPDADFFSFHYRGFKTILDFDAEDKTFVAIILPMIVSDEEELLGDDLERVCGRVARTIKCCFAFCPKPGALSVSCDLRAESADHLKFLLTRQFSALAPSRAQSGSRRKSCVPRRQRGRHCIDRRSE